jgi:hypothetical protein
MRLKYIKCVYQTTELQVFISKALNYNSRADIINKSFRISIVHHLLRIMIFIKNYCFVQLHVHNVKSIL